MSEHLEHPDLAPAAHDPSHGSAQESAPSAEHVDAGDGWEAEETGVTAVDDVLASVQALEGRPVAEHVAIFEQAHERLRRALDPRHG